MLELPFLHQINHRGHGGEQQRRIAKQREHDMDRQPGVAHGFALPAGDRIAQRGYQRHHEHQGKDEDAQALGFIAPVDGEEGRGDHPCAERHGFKNVVGGKMILDQSLFHDGDEVEQRADAERCEGNAKEAFAPAQNGDDGIEKAERIESGGDTKPEKTGFAHVSDSLSV